MEIALCRICLRSDKSQEEMRSIFGEDLSQQSSLQTKLQSLGFLQVDEGDGLPSQLCGWCATRVDDAYELKQLCVRSRSNLLNLHDQVRFVKAEKCEAEQFEALDLRTTPSSILNRQSARPGSSFGSPMLNFTRKMMICFQKLSAALRKLVLIINEALNFTNDTLSSVSTMWTLPTNDILNVKKMLILEHQADDWKSRSVSVEEAVSFVHLLTLACSPKKFLSGQAFSSMTQHWPEYGDPYSLPESNVSSDTSGVSELWPDNASSSKSLSSSDDASIILKKDSSFGSVCKGPQMTHEENLTACPAPICERDLPLKHQEKKMQGMPSPFTSKPVFLVVPKLKKKKSFPINNLVPNPASETKRKSGCNSVEKPKRKKKSHQRTITNSEVSAKLASTHNASVDVATGVQCNETASSPLIKPPTSNSIMCQSCGKFFESMKQMQKHFKVDGDCSGFPCSYCDKKFSTSWNRTQHERCHTGLKPYVCDVCEESFRYNVTLRHHKLRAHASSPKTN